MGFIDSWFLSVAPIIIMAAMHICNMKMMNKADAALNGVIRSRQDLELVRDAINVSMILAMMFIAMFVILLLAGACLIFFKQMHFLVFAAHIFIFGVVTLPMGLFGMTREKAIKNLCVESTDPEIAEKYARYLKQWKEPRLTLAD